MTLNKHQKHEFVGLLSAYTLATVYFTMIGSQVIGVQKSVVFGAALIIAAVWSAYYTVKYELD